MRDSFVAATNQSRVIRRDAMTSNMVKRCKKEKTFKSIAVESRKEAENVLA